MVIHGVPIDDTFAEAFGMTGCRVIVTAIDRHWAEIVGRVVTGYACSVIGCDVEAGIERFLGEDETPDGRPGVSLLFFAFNREALGKAVANRVGQCVMTCPTTACYDGLPGSEKTIPVGGQLRYYGDHHQISKLLEGRRYWRIPVMDGEFVCEDSVGVVKGVAGGNFMILGGTLRETLSAAQAACEAIDAVVGAIAPFPGGIVRAGSKVGAARYKKLRASTNDPCCPTLRSQSTTMLPPDVRAVYEIVIDGLSLEAVREAMRVGVHAACQPGIVFISAGNYGGSLGPFHISLHEILQSPTTALA